MVFLWKKDSKIRVWMWPLLLPKLSGNSITIEESKRIWKDGSLGRDLIEL